MTLPQLDRKSNQHSWNQRLGAHSVHSLQFSVHRKTSGRFDYMTLSVSVGGCGFESLKW